MKRILGLIALLLSLLLLFGCPTFPFFRHGPRRHGPENEGRGRPPEPDRHAYEAPYAGPSSPSFDLEPRGE